ncbi:MAG: hypothetical protein LBU62_11585 [Bacteroidales bacterium]|jgi:hypothetical protein|nr:hypothetical protein [Bacteroidales bacterium]
MQKQVIILGVAIIMLAISCAESPRTFRQASEDFQTMPAKFRPNPLWFWNNSKVEPAELKAQMAGYKEAGYGGLSILPFGRDFEPKYLTEEYFNVYKLCVEEAKKMDLTLWIYDEYGFPSGTAGDINGDGVGRFKQKYPEHTNKRLDKTEFFPKAEQVFEQTLPAERIMAVVAMDTLTYQRIDLSDKVADGILKWTPAEGAWKVLVFTCVDAGNTIMDYMSPEAADLYIGMTHDEYYKRFGDDFGATVTGTFFDEPTLYYANGRSWTPDFNQKFESRYGFSPALYYPALWYDIGAETAEARNYLFGFRSELYAAGYPKKVSDWSRAHGVLATGHQDNEEVVNPVGTSGDLMKCFKYQDIPGIDKIGGNRPAERFYKLVSSAAYNWDHSLVMSESYGAMGNISWNTMFGIAMDQYAKGINILIPHAVWYNTKRITFLPELSLRNPIYADSLRVFTDYLSRLNVLMQNDARWTGDVAVLYPIHTMQSGHYLDGPLSAYNGGVGIPELDYVEVGVALFDSLGCDFMFLHPEILDEQCHVVKDKLLLDNKTQYNSFSTLVIPSSSTISLSNLEKIRAFVNVGGRVIFTGRMPSKATITADNDKAKALLQELSTNKQVTLVEKPTPARLKAALSAGDCSLTFTGNAAMRNVHKILNGKNLWFFANPELTAKTVAVELSGKYDLEVWNPHTGTVKQEIKTVRKNGKTSFQLSLDGVQSVFVVEK